MLALRSKIILASARGLSSPTPRCWGARFFTQPLDGLIDELRPGRPPAILFHQSEGVGDHEMGAHLVERDALVRRGLSPSSNGRGSDGSFEVKRYVCDLLSFRPSPVRRQGQPLSPSGTER